MNIHPFPVPAARIRRPAPLSVSILAQLRYRTGQDEDARAVLRECGITHAPLVARYLDALAGTGR